MDFFDIKTLKKDDAQDGLFNMFESTFRMLTEYDQQILVVDKDSAMRPDLICNQVYDRVDLVDFILNLNDIDNPLNIMENDIIFYTSFGSIDAFRIKNAEITETRNLLLNSNKATQKDKNRQKYVEENYALTPTMMPNPQPHIKIEGNDFIIGQR